MVYRNLEEIGLRDSWDYDNYHFNPKGVFVFLKIRDPNNLTLTFGRKMLRTFEKINKMGKKMLYRWLTLILNLKL